MKKLLAVAAPILLTAAWLVLSGCGLGRLGSGILVWAENEEQLPTGSFLYVWDDSRIRKTYLVENEKGGSRLEVPQSRVIFFKDEGEARAFHKEFSLLKSTWAYAQKQGHPLREEADPTAKQIYKLRNGERLKVLSKAKEKTKLTTREGYWYQLMTEDGHVGYSFDAYLRIEDGTQPAAIAENGAADSYLQSLYTENWRPEEYENMVKDTTIDLDTFKDEFSLRVFDTEKRVVITLPKINFTAPYTAILNLGQGQPYYQFEGSSLRIRFSAADRLVATFSYGGKEVARTFYVMGEDQDVTDLVSKEMARRKTAWDTYLGHGNTLSSPAAGSLQIREDRTLTWTGYDRLVDIRILPPNLKDGTASVNFDHFMVSELRDKYEGVISLTFTTLIGNRTQSFLYKFNADGVLWMPVADLDIKNKIVQKEKDQAAPLFFRFSRE